jgi:hypothetical protein
MEILFCSIGHNNLDSLFVICGKVGWWDAVIVVFQIRAESGGCEVAVGWF